MVAQVHDNAMVAHIWAQGRQESARSHNGNFYFIGSRIYSYGSHFVAGVRLPDGTFLVNDSGYSQTTVGKHMPAVRRATGYKYHSLPDLTVIVDSVESIAAHKVDGRGHSPHHKTALLQYLDTYYASLSDDAGAYLLELATGGKRRWSVYKGRLMSANERKLAADRKALLAHDRRDAADLAKVPLALVRERSWKQADSYGNRALRDELKSWNRLHKAAGGKRIKAAVWARIKAARAILKIAERLTDRYGNRNDFVGCRAAISTLRRARMADHNLIAPVQAFTRAGAMETIGNAAAHLLHNCDRMPTSTRARLRGLAEWAEQGVRFIDGERREVERKRRERADLRGILRSLRAYMPRVSDHEEYASTVLARPEQRAAYFYRWDSQIDLLARTGRFPVLAAKLAALQPEIVAMGDARQTAEELISRQQRERRAEWLALPPEGRCTAWRAGESVMPLQPSDTRETGPLLRAVGAEVDGCRITAGELQTSEGARVPLRHAFAVFGFVRDCRAKGLPWLPENAGHDSSHARHGPAHIRVGHFQVDSITAEGDFRAGCHSIKWAEVERLARSLGVFDCETVSPEAVA